MNKIILSLAGVMAAAAFAPEASALPIFSRQTGRACNACHYQHFPLLNSVGQDFKSSGFTQIGTKGKFKGEDLSIPDNLNLGVYATAYFQTQAKGKTANIDNAPAITKWGVPGNGGELSLFLGGRISDFAGFLAEAGLGGNGAPNSGGVVGAAKLVMLFPVGEARIGPVIYSSPDQGVAYSFELLNTGAVGVHKMMGNTGPSDQHVKAAYAAQYLGTSTAATGIDLVANNSMGFINIGAYEMAGNDFSGGVGAGNGGVNSLGLTYLRVATTLALGAWDAGFGIQNFGGKSTVTGGNDVPYTGITNAPKATIIDAQLQGDLGTMPVGFYASFGTAAAGTATETNVLNPAGGTGAPGAKSANSFNVAAEFGIVPHVATVQVALRMAKNGAATNDSDNALMLGATYALAQNVSLSFHHTMQSGSAWNVDSTGNQPDGKTADTLLLQTSF
jgi:hypothetical protein